MAQLAKCSTSTIQAIELNKLVLSEGLARSISAATHVHLRWLLENDLSAPIARSPDGKDYTKAVFENARALHTIGSEHDEFMSAVGADYAASFYGQICAIIASAVRKDGGELALWRIAKFLEDCRAEFGHDRRLIPDAQQFGGRSADDSPYLKNRQVEAGITLFLKYVGEREAVLKAAQQPPGGEKTRRRTPKTGAALKRAGEAHRSAKRQARKRA